MQPKRRLKFLVLSAVNRAFPKIRLTNKADSDAVFLIVGSMDVPAELRRRRSPPSRITRNSRSSSDFFGYRTDRTTTSIIIAHRRERSKPFAKSTISAGVYQHAST